MTDEAPVQNEIEFISGSNNILFVAPHGVETKPYDDEKTAELTREIQQYLNCNAIVNSTFRKPNNTKKSKRNGGIPDLKNQYLDLNKIEQAKLHPTFIPKIKEVVDEKGLIHVFWIHGIDDKNIKKGIECYVGCGQSNSKAKIKKSREARYTATQEIIDDFLTQLNNVGIKTTLAPEDSKYRGWSRDYMNQWFRIEGYTLEQAQSIQLEFKYTGIREKDCIQSAGEKIAKAISNLLSVPFLPMDAVDDEKVEKAYNKLAQVFSKNYEQALMETGQYIVRTFYGGEEGIEEEKYQEDFRYAPEIIENTRNKKSSLDDSLRQLYAKISDDKERNTPSQAWIYNAVNLVVLQYDMEKLLTEEDHFQTFRNLLLSQKLFLLSVEDDIRKKVIEDCHGKTLTVKQFKALLAGFQSKEDSEPLKLSAILRKPEELEKEENVGRLDPEKLIKEKKSTLNGLKKIAEDKHDTAQFKIDALKKELKKWERYSQNCDAAKGNIEKAIESKDKQPKKKSAKAKPKSDNPSA